MTWHPCLRRLTMPDHRSTTSIYGSDQRSMVAVNDGHRWRTIVEHHRTTVDHHGTTGQQWLIGRVSSGHGPGLDRVGSGSSLPRGMPHVSHVCPRGIDVKWIETGAKAGIYEFVAIKSAQCSKSRQSREKSLSMPWKRAQENESNGAFGFYWTSPEEYAQEILGFSNNSSSVNPTSTSEPILSDASLSLTPFEGSDFILEEIDAYLKDESISPEINHDNCNPEGDICLIEKLLNNDPFQLLPMDLKQGEVLLLQEFYIIIHDKKGTKNLAADHLSRLENPRKDVFENKDINENFPLETLGKISSGSTPWYILVAVDYLSKWVEAKALFTNDARIVVKILKSLFTRFRIPRAIISDHGTHFCNDKFSKVMSKYGVTHHHSTAYHSQTIGQVEVSNLGLKRILERTVSENRASWYGYYKYHKKKAKNRQNGHDNRKTAGKEAEWLKNLLFEIPLWVKPMAPISIRCDIAATFAKAYSQMYNGKSRHLGVRHIMIRELITNEVISIKFVRSQQNLVDHLMKGLTRDLVIKSAEGMGLKSN
nr:zinc finger, CCHC-type [Tanacetum cinerariifolium]